MGPFETILVAGIGLSVVQLSAGLAIGLWLARRGPAGGSASDHARARRLAADLDGIALQLNESVQQHADRLAEADERLREEPSAGSGDGRRGPLTDMVVGVVGELLTANRGLLGQLHDSRRELEHRLAELSEYRDRAHTDALTGLPNRRSLDEHLRTWGDAWRRHRTPFALMMIDVDHFKRFNDTHGHQAGDDALRAVAEAIRGALRNHDVVARYGGEEFAVVLPQTSLVDAEPAVRKILACVSEVDAVTPTGAAPLTVSVGVAGVLKHETSGSLVDRADRALYAAKEHGRNQAWKHTAEGLAPLAGGSPPASDDGDPSRLERVCSDLTASLADFVGETAVD